jgi:hypothetical protein
MKKEGDELSQEIASSIELTIKHYKPDLQGDPKHAFLAASQLIGLFWKEFRVNPLQHMQNIFDKEGIDIKFIAIPKDSELNRYGFTNTASGVSVRSDTHDHIVRYPFNPDMECPYYVWTIVERIGEYYEDLTLLHVTAEENFNRLAQTGVLMMRPGSEVSRIAQAPNN